VARSASACLYAIGYANVDVVAHVPKLVSDGSRVTATAIELRPGGMAANCACAAAQLGAPTQLLASIGTDEIAAVLLNDLAMRNVGVRYLHRGRRTTVALVTVTPDGQRAIVSEPVDYDAAQVRKALVEADARRRLLYVDGYHLGRARAELELARRLGFLVYCDLDGAPDTYAATDVEQALACIDVAQWNAEVARAWLPELDEDERVAWLAARVKTVVTTGGDRDVSVTTDGETVSCPVPAVDHVQDTTGAGDIFAGAMVYALAQGSDVVDAVRQAIPIASSSVRHVGSRLPLADR
jgi:sugar/nucleoside kinase (ribokinase family)